MVNNIEGLGVWLIIIKRDLGGCGQYYRGTWEGVVKMDWEGLVNYYRGPGRVWLII